MTQQHRQPVYVRQDNAGSERKIAVKDNLSSANPKRMAVVNQTPAQYKSAFLRRVKIMREATRLSQAKMAEKLEITEKAYAKYEARSLMPHHLIPRFCSLTGFDVWFMLTGERAAAPRPAPPLKAV